VTLIDWPNQKEEEWKGMQEHRYAWVYTTQVTAYNHCKNLALGKAKWLAVIDSDEFITILPGGHFPPFLNLRETLDTLPVDGRRYRVNWLSNAVPQTPCEESASPVQLFTTFTKPERVVNYKAFFPSATFQYVDLGSHVGRVFEPFNNGSTFIDTDFGILHFHFSVS
jgi:hypothetical protein